VLTLTGFVVLAEGLDMLGLGAAATGDRKLLVRRFILCENNFGWMDVWGLNPEQLGLH
jgi:hypothetical protein